MLPPDRHGRPLRSLRVSVTDRCNLRCHYCMPEEEYAWLPRTDLLQFEELARLVRIFAGAGVRRVRLTGGEPLLRRDLDRLVALLAAIPGVEDLALTTNGLLLAEAAQRLRDAGLHRVTVSLDSLRPERFHTLTRQNALPAVLEGLEAAVRVFGSAKIDTVVLRGVNDDELVPLLAYARSINAELRFIEYMDVGGATRWAERDVVSRQELVARLREHYGAVTPLAKTDWAPADRFELPDGTSFGIISSTTEPFCGTCDRGRLTADGLFLRCLYARDGLDLRTLLRGGALDAEIVAAVSAAWAARADRGAEERRAERQRTAFVPVQQLRERPHLEMHTRGG